MKQKLIRRLLDGVYARTKANMWGRGLLPDRLDIIRYWIAKKLMGE